MQYRVRLEILHERHAQALFEAGKDESIWLYLPGKAFRTVSETRAWILDALSAYQKGARIPYAIVDVATNRAVGSTSFLNIRKDHRTVMIGWTWISPAYQRTGFNTECKYLMLEYAFETMNAVRVEMRADERNLKSISAMERIGAVREGTLRMHMIEDGFIRNTVYYSFIHTEWPQAQKHIQALMSKSYSSTLKVNKLTEKNAEILMSE